MTKDNIVFYIFMIAVIIVFFVFAGKYLDTRIQPIKGTVIRIEE